jgi:dipicolinate synthase subunit A
MERIVILGGDLRSFHLYGLIREKYENLKLVGFDKIDPLFALSEKVINAATFIIAPIPFTVDGKYIYLPQNSEQMSIEDVLSIIRCNVTILCNSIGNLNFSKAVNVIDLSKNEEFLQKNTIATVEGIVEIMIRESDLTIHSSTVLIVGMGRIGSRLGSILQKFGSRISVVTNEQREKGIAFAEGFDLINFESLIDNVSKYDIVINTVPYPYFSRDIISKIKKSTLFIDVASQPGAIEECCKAEIPFKYLVARGIPGKSSPLSVAKYLADEVDKIILAI